MMEIVAVGAGMLVLFSWLFLFGAVIQARYGGMRDERSRCLGWLAARDSDVWSDYLKFLDACDNGWRES